MRSFASHFLAATLGGFLVPGVRAAEPPLPPEEPAALQTDGFEKLFNGTDLEGWRKVGGTGSFKAEDGNIIASGRNIRGNTFLRTEGTYGDFVLVFEFKFLDPAGNSGVQIRSQQKDGDGRVFGYQCEHDTDRKQSFTAGLYDEARRGWLYPGPTSAEGTAEAFSEQGQRLFRWDDWNRIVIRCEGRRIRTWLNGEARADFLDEDEEDFSARGFIALQIHGGKSGHIAWRNIYLKPL